MSRIFSFVTELETDEMFLVHSGRLTIHYRDHSVELGPWDIHVVPKGAEHKPESAAPCEIVLIEPGGTLNTGDRETERTRQADDWT